jgi:hypothetical protein
MSGRHQKTPLTEAAACSGSISSRFAQAFVKCSYELEGQRSAGAQPGQIAARAVR